MYPPSGSLESTAHIPRYSLCSYALKYWSRHYKLIPMINRPMWSALEVCQSKGTRQILVQANCSLRKPLTRTENVFLSPLPVIAALGLQDFLSKWLELNAESNNQDGLVQSLAEAARNGCVEVVRTLLPIGGYTKSNLEDSLVASTSKCDRAILEILINYAGQSCDDFEWPPVLMC